MKLWWAENEALMSWEWCFDELRMMLCEADEPAGWSSDELFVKLMSQLQNWEAEMFIHLSVWCWDVYTPLSVSLLTWAMNIESREVSGELWGFGLLLSVGRNDHGSWGLMVSQEDLMLNDHGSWGLMVSQEYLKLEPPFGRP